MFNKNFKLVLAALVLGAAVWQITVSYIGNGIMLILLSLMPKQEGYYHYLNGLMISQTNMVEAEKHFKNAERLGLNMSADMAMTKLNLAGIAMTKNRKREAELLMAEAKKLDKHNMLDDQIKMMKQQMKKMGQPRQQFGKAGRGGRRY